MKLKSILLSENWFSYRLKHAEFRNGIKKMGHRPNFGATNFLILLIFPTILFSKKAV